MSQRMLEDRRGQSGRGPRSGPRGPSCEAMGFSARAHPRSRTDQEPPTRRMGGRTTSSSSYTEAGIRGIAEQIAQTDQDFPLGAGKGHRQRLVDLNAEAGVGHRRGRPESGTEEPVVHLPDHERARRRLVDVRGQGRGEVVEVLDVQPIAAAAAVASRSCAPGRPIAPRCGCTAPTPATARWPRYSTAAATRRLRPLPPRPRSSGRPTATARHRQPEDGHELIVDGLVEAADADDEGVAELPVEADVEEAATLCAQVALAKRTNVRSGGSHGPCAWPFVFIPGSPSVGLK